MCFSPAISFAASVGLAGTGLLTLSKTTSRREMLFAAMPLLFAVQQLIEGFLWLALLDGGYPVAQYWLTQSYTVFAGMIWPIFPALGLLLIEPSRERKNLLLVLIAIGGGIALYVLTGLIRYGVTSRIANHCILYEYSVEQSHATLILYVIATCVGFFLSSHRSIRWLGAVNVAAFIVAYQFYYYHLVSVWCLFAAIVSGLIYLHFSRAREIETAPAIASA